MSDVILLDCRSAVIYNKAKKKNYKLLASDSTSTALSPICTSYGVGIIIKLEILLLKQPF